MKKWLAFLTLAICLFICSFSLADDVLRIRIDSVAYVETEKSYLSIQCELPEEADVMISVTDSSDRLVYQHNYGVCSGLFTSEDIYLKIEDISTDYTIRLTGGTNSYDLVVRRKIQRLKDNTACSVGYPLSSLNGRSSWQSGTFLSKNALAGAPVTVPLHASGNTTLGSVTFSLSGDHLITSINPDPSADFEMTGSSICIASTQEEIQSLGTQGFHGTSGSVGSSISWPASDIIAVFVRLTVSYNPASLPASPQISMSGQESLYHTLQASW